MYTQEILPKLMMRRWQLEQVYAALLEQLQTGVLAQELMNIAPDSKVKTRWYCRCSDYFRSFPLTVAVLSSIYFGYPVPAGKSDGGKRAFQWSRR